MVNRGEKQHCLVTHTFFVASQVHLGVDARGQYFKLEVSLGVAPASFLLSTFVPFGGRIDWSFLLSNKLHVGHQTQAFNEATFRIPDEDGWQPSHEKIDKQQPYDEVLSTDLPLPVIQGKPCSGHQRFGLVLVGLVKRNCSPRFPYTHGHEMDRRLA
jgi:hypothetical protein